MSSYYWTEAYRQAEEELPLERPGNAIRNEEWIEAKKLIGQRAEEIYEELRREVD